jgi:hypothetical protein
MGFIGVTMIARRDGARSQIVTSFALAANVLASFSLPPCIAHSAWDRLPAKVNKS